MGPASTSLRCTALCLAALNIAPSLAHVMEAPPRLHQWTLELWREATVLNGQFAVFGAVGGPIEIATILVTAWLGWRLWKTDGARLGLFAAAAFMAALIAWLTLVAPANAILATWLPGPVPANAEAVRMRWETGHMICAGIKSVAFVLLTIACCRRGDVAAVPQR